jgi:thiosulfate/3-mercaptopyruvate sulfurtransferase
MTDVTCDELAGRLGEESLTLLDVRTRAEYAGTAGYPCDARQGHVPGARHLDLQELLAASGADGIRALVGVAEGAEVIVYCHSGGRSAIAAQALAAAGYLARNYVGSWHEWSADETLPIEEGCRRDASDREG